MSWYTRIRSSRARSCVPARRLVTIGDRNLFEVGEMHLADLLAFLRSIQPTATQRAIAEIPQRAVTTGVHQRWILES